MNKGKFASLIMLGAFSARVASSSAVSAQGDANLASHMDLTTNQLALYSKITKTAANDKIDFDNETVMNEEIKDVSDTKSDAENIDQSTENKKDLPENLSKENSEDKNYMFVDDAKKSEENKTKNVKLAEIIALAAGGTGTVVGAGVGIRKLVKSFGKDGKKDEPSTDPTPEPDIPSDPKKVKTREQTYIDDEILFGIVGWYKNTSPWVTVPVSIFALYIIQAIVRIIYHEIQQSFNRTIYLSFGEGTSAKNIRPFFGLWKGFTKPGRFCILSNSK